MSTPLARTSGWTQPNPLEADRNLHTVHRKFGNGDRPAAGPPPTTPKEAPASTPAEPAVEAEEQRAAPPAASAASADAVPDAVPDSGAQAGTDAAAVAPDALDQAHERRLAKQWEAVVDRLCRDFAPAGGADRKLVLTQIAQQRAQLDSATVRDYLPVLVDRAVRRLYASDEAAPRGPGSSAR